MSLTDEAYMEQALLHAARAAGQTTPNPLVGAVVVSAAGTVVGRGRHRRAGEAHAEAAALDDAGVDARGGTLYVTLEPCCHTARTGPCTRRIIETGVVRVVAAMVDPDPRVSGRGIAELREAGITVDMGLGGATARRLNAGFISVQERGRPFVIAKAATSLDGRVAARAGAPTALTGLAANRRTHLLRASVDAIAVGSGTVLADDPRLTVRECFRQRPLTRVIFDRRLRTPASARLFSTLDAGPVIIVTSSSTLVAHPERAAALKRAGALLMGGAGGLDEGIRRLLTRDISSVLLEGGPSVQAAAWRAGLVDRVVQVVAPVSLGAEGVPWLDVQALPPGALETVVAEPRAADTWIESDVYRNR